MDTTTLEALLEQGQDTALLRFTLGNLLYQQQDYARAEQHLAQALKMDPDYSAAWKVYGRTLAGAGKQAEAASAFNQGITVAQQRGDIQAAKEMTVFLRRLEKKLSADDAD